MNCLITLLVAFTQEVESQQKKAFDLLIVLASSIAITVVKLLLHFITTVIRIELLSLMRELHN